jgi:hypothetical protein
MLDNRRLIIDDACKLADTGGSGTNLLTSSAAATIDGTAETFDTGGGYTEAKWVLDIASVVGAAAAASVSGIEIALEASTTSTFTDWVKLARLKLGPEATTHTRESSDNSAASGAVGRYVYPIHNLFNGTVYRYLRVYAAFGPTVDAQSIGFQSWLSK